MSEPTIIDAVAGLQSLFPGSFVFCREPDRYSIERPEKEVGFELLMQVCAALECKPDELFFNADVEYGDCDTNGYGSTWSLLEFVVRRKILA